MGVFSAAGKYLKYRRGNHDTCGEHHQDHERCSEPPIFLCSAPWEDIMMHVWDVQYPHVYHDIPHGNEHPLRYSR